MSNHDSDRNDGSDREFLDSFDRKEADFSVDEPGQLPKDSFTQEEAYGQPSSTADDPSISTEVDSAERKVPAYEPRRQTPSHILFLPNMASRTSEKELAEFAEHLPCKVKKTFMYMSDVAYHGFIECFSVEEASKNLEHINSHKMEVKGKRVLAEYSRRKSVQDRRTYETRQHVRKERQHGDSGRRPPRHMSPPPMRRRSRSRSPPRGYRPRSPPPRGPRDRYPPPRDYRDDYYRREGPPPPPPREYRYPPRHYADYPPATHHRREYEDRGVDEYRRYEAYPPPASRGYPRGPSPVSTYGDNVVYDRQPSYATQQPPVASYTPHQPPAAAAPPVRDPYMAHVPYGAAPVSHPLLSMRPTSIGTTSSQAPAYQYQPYR